MSRSTILALTCLVAVLVFGYLYRPDIVRNYLGVKATARDAGQAMLFANDELFAAATKLADAEAAYGIDGGQLAVAMNAQGTTSKDGVALDSISETVATGDEIIALIDQALKDVERAKSFVTSPDSLSPDGKSLMFKNRDMCKQALGSYAALLDTMLGARISEAGMFPTLKKIQSTLDEIKNVGDNGIRVRDYDQVSKPPSSAAFLELCGASDTTPAQILAALDRRANINATNDDGLTPLNAASRSNENPEVVAALIARGANPNAKNSGGLTPLHYAAESNDNPAIITLLIKAGADVNAKNKDGRTPLWAAIINDNAKVLEFLITAGADVNPNAAASWTPLHRAASNNRKPIYSRILINAGADVNAKNEGGVTPLHAAVASRYPEVITLLIEAGAAVNAKDAGGATPLHYAAFSENPEVATTLIKAGADVNAKDNDGDTPLDWAVVPNNKPKYAEVLRAAGGKRGKDLP